MASVTIIGGGPGGYEAAHVAAQLGADVTLVDSDGIGGSAVLTDCVPSKALIATAEAMTLAGVSQGLGVRLRDDVGRLDLAGLGARVTVDLAAVNSRVLGLAQAQSTDITKRLEADGVQLLSGRGRLTAAGEVAIDDGTVLRSDAVLVATGARPRVVAGVEPDGERILTWTHVYGLAELPPRLVVVGSGVTGAEFASGYLALGSDVALVSSRDRVLPGEDPDAAQVLEDVLKRRGMTVMSQSRMESVRRTADGVVVTLTDGRTVEGSHCLLAIGSVPNTEDLGLEDAGVALDGGGFITVDKVSRTSARGVYAAGDCTGVLMLASVAAMQGRIAMLHALGDVVLPLDHRVVASNVFTDPEIATVGVTQADIDSGEVEAHVVKLALAGNARAKMLGITDGFVKLFATRRSRTVIGGVVVAPRASELIFPITLAVQNRNTVDEFASAFTVYPSLTGSIAEAARRLHGVS